MESQTVAPYVPEFKFDLLRGPTNRFPCSNCDHSCREHESKEQNPYRDGVQFGIGGLRDTLVMGRNRPTLRKPSPQDVTQSVEHAPKHSPRNFQILCFHRLSPSLA